MLFGVVIKLTNLKLQRARPRAVDDRYFVSPRGWGHPQQQTRQQEEKSKKRRSRIFPLQYTQYYSISIIKTRNKMDGRVDTCLSLPCLPHDLLLIVVGYLTTTLNPLPLIPLSAVCKSWRDYINIQDSNLWQMLSVYFSVPLHIPSKVTASRFSLRSTANYKRQFFQVFHREQAGYTEKHEALILQAKSILEQKRDGVHSLKKLINKLFPKKYMGWDKGSELDKCKKIPTKQSRTKKRYSHKPHEDGNITTCSSQDRGFLPSSPIPKNLPDSPSFVSTANLGRSKPDQLHTVPDLNFLMTIDPYFDANWRSAMLEDNALLTLSARYCHLKSMRFIVEELGGDIDIPDMGGFTALIICAFRGFMPGVQYCVKKGGNIYAVGRLRSGEKLTAEHWAAVQGNVEIFQYLRAHRMRKERKLKESQNPSADGSSNSLIHLPKSTPQEHKVDSNTIAPFDVEMTTASSSSSFSSSSSSSISVPPLNIPQTSQLDSDWPNVEGSFCICGKGFIGAMVACDHPQCTVEWYHFECVGLHDPVRDLSIKSCCLIDYFFVLAVG